MDFSEIIKHIKNISFEITDPAEKKVQVVSEEACLKLSQKYKKTLRMIYTQALKSDIYPHRYIRNRSSITQADQIALAGATVTVMGVGGLGGNVLQVLSRMGIGGLIVFDPDKFDETNLNRQVLCNCDTLGAFKADSAAEIIHRVNPAVDLFCHRRKFHPKKDEWLVQRSHVIVDALDNAQDRLSLGIMARKLGIPLIHGAIAGFEGRIMTVYPEDKGLEVLYPTDDSSENVRMAEDLLGVCGVTPYITGALQAMEAVKIILKKRGVLQNTLLHLSLDVPSMEKFQMGQTD